MIKRIILFAILNFGALAIGGLFTPSGLSSDWYLTLSKAPWTPPGWVFGFAWTFIMICLTIYMAIALKNKNGLLTKFYIVQLILNIIWTPTFFYFHYMTLSFVFIILLTSLIATMSIYFNKHNNCKSILLYPYLIWLCIATSLNWYTVFYN